MGETTTTTTNVHKDVSELIQRLVRVGEASKQCRSHWQVLVPCLRMMQPVVDEIKQCSDESDVLFVLSLETALERVQELLARAATAEGSSRVCKVMRCQEMAKWFQDASLILEEALKCIPFEALEISEHNRSQAEACISELRRAKYLPDISDLVLLDEIQMLLSEMRDKRHVRPEKLLKLFDKLGITSDEALSQEMDALESIKEQARAEKRKSDEELYECIISMLMQVVRYSPDGSQVIPEHKNVPADFRCPLCLELMGDPVIIASGQTYERAYIQQWLDKGNTTCPKTRKVLAHAGMIPNYTVKALITNWCEANDVPLPAPATLSNSLPVRKLQRNTGAVDTATTNNSAAAAVTATAVDAAAATDDASFVSQASSTPRSVRTVRSVYDHSPKTKRTSSREEEERLLGLLRASPAPSSGEIVATPRTIDASINLSDYSPYSSDISGEFERMTSVLSARTPGRRNLQPLDRPHSFPSLLNKSSKRKDEGIPQRRTVSVPKSSARAITDGALMALVEGHVEDLRSVDPEVQLAASRELRFLAKYDAGNRVAIAAAGAIPPLVELVSSSKDRRVQENAVTALLNLSIDDSNKSAIIAAGAVEPLVRLLSSGSSQETSAAATAAVENSAATLLILSILDENKPVIAAAGAIPPLVELLKTGTLRGQKDAATALFNLSLLHDNKAAVVAAGAVAVLVSFVREPTGGMVDKAVAVLANLMTVAEGRQALGEEEGGIAGLVEVLEAGSARGKENAAAALLHLCINSAHHSCLVLQEGVIPPLHTLSQHGTPRAKEKAAALLRHFREQRHASFMQKSCSFSS